VIELKQKGRDHILLLLLLALSLAGCSPADVRDIKNAASDSATLAAVVVETQPAKNAQSAATTKQPKKPTSSATKNTAPTPTTGKRIKDTPGDFDFYVMSLSWSPDYCAGNDDPQQCSVGKKLGFVLHGLWPQYTRGYPADCSNVKLPKDARQMFPNLYPSNGLYTHEWNKHGTCSGLTPNEYMTLAQTLKNSIEIPAEYRQPAKAFRTTPAELIAAFTADNPQLSEEALAVQCSGSGRFLQELRVCFSRAGQPVACSPEVLNDAAKSCRNADFLVRNVK
jgi:ribonuclease T2